MAIAGSPAVYLGHAVEMAFGTRQANLIGNIGTESNVFRANFIAPCSGYIVGLFVKMAVAPGVGNSVAFDVRRGATFTTGTSAIISGTDTEAHSLGRPVVQGFSPGDPISMAVIAAGSPANSEVWWGFMWVPTSATVGYPLMTRMSQDNLSSGDTEYLPSMGFPNAIGTIRETALIYCPAAGTFRNLFATVETNPGAARSRTFTIQKATWAGGSTWGAWSDTALTTTIADLATSNSDQSNSFTVVENDLIVIQTVPTNGPSATVVRTSLCFEPDDGETFIWPSNSDSLLFVGKASPITRYYEMLTADMIADTVEADVQQVGWSDGSEFEFTSARVYLDGAPQFGTSYDFDLRKNGATVPLADLRVAGNVAFQDRHTGLSVPLDHYADTWNTRVIGTGNPIARHWSMTHGLRNTRKPTVHILGQTAIFGQTSIL